MKRFILLTILATCIFKANAGEYFLNLSAIQKACSYQKPEFDRFMEELGFDGLSFGNTWKQYSKDAYQLETPQYVVTFDFENPSKPKITVQTTDALFNLNVLSGLKKYGYILTATNYKVNNVLGKTYSSSRYNIVYYETQAFKVWYNLVITIK